MAGIGFELKKLWDQGSYRSLLRAYTMTTLMGAGPGIFMILSLSVTCFFSLFSTPSYKITYQFLSIITYLLSSSMIIGSFLQFTFFRCIADIVIEKDFNKITPNFIGVLFLQLIISISISIPVVFYFLSEYSFILKLELVSIFIILSMIWVSVVLLTGNKAYRFIIWGFSLGYFSMIVVHFLLDEPNLISMLFEFLIAQVIILIFLLHSILDYYPTSDLIRFDFLKKENFYFSLFFSSFFYTFGFWIDKYLFWYNDNTGFVIFPPLRLSPVYDLPMFIAYLAIIPTTSTFLMQIEANFGLIYPKFMKTIFRRKTYAEISAVKSELVLAGKESVLSLFKTQSTMTVIMFLSASFILSTFNILPIYLNILLILIIAVGLNIILWGLLNILYYLTEYLHALYVCIIFATSNFTFTLISLYAGPSFFGYGVGLSLLLSISFALIYLNKDFKNLEYSTFMMTD